MRGEFEQYFVVCVHVFTQFPFHVLAARFCIELLYFWMRMIRQKSSQQNPGNFLFFSADFHQGNERFSVHSRGKQCAFMSLSALLTTQNIPLNSWSSITFKNALLQGDKLFLNALDSGFIILDPSLEFLSVENLPTVVNVACCMLQEHVE